MHFNKEARRRYVAFATGPDGHWRGNFRDLNASVTRLCTLAPAGRITEAEVDEESARLRQDWAVGLRAATGRELGGADDEALLQAVLGDEAVAALDRFDRVQLAEVVRTCRRSRSLSAAGRELFQASRRRRKDDNDADRLRKYLLKHGLSFQRLVELAAG